MNTVAMEGAGVAAAAEAGSESGLLASVRELAAGRLASEVQAIDQEDIYPERIIRDLGAMGAYAAHVRPEQREQPGLMTTIRANAIVSEYCLSTGFSIWCQSALGWYLRNSANEAVQAELGPGIADGSVLGGTGLSNPMKSLFGIEKLLLRGTQVDGGYVVNGRLPWVSNLGPGHFLGIVFELVGPGGDTRQVMAVAECDAYGLTMTANDNFLAMGGTRTFGLSFRDVFIPAARVLADPIDDYLPRIRAGFILLQAGMAFGMLRACIRLMEQVRRPLGHVNCHLPDQPEDFARKLEQLERTVDTLCATPYEPGQDYFVEVLRARLMAGEVAFDAAHNTMLHCGARGYVTGAAAQRKMREAYFILIVTPASKQLRKMLADLGAQTQRLAA